MYSIHKEKDKVSIKSWHICLSYPSGVFQAKVARYKQDIPSTERYTAIQSRGSGAGLALDL